MRILVIEDEELALKDILRQIKSLKIFREEEITPFKDSTEALHYIKNNQVDIMLLDINMPGISGLSLAKEAKALQPECKIIFTTGYSEYAVEAFKIKAQGYLLKPIMKKELETEMKFCLEHMKQIYIQCFGNFAIFYQGKPVHFHRAKAKELLAYLVDRKGAYVSQAELVAVLWEDQPDDSNKRSLLRNLVASLRQTFGEIGCNNIILTGRNEIAVNKDVFECDYYDYLESNQKELSLADVSNYMCNYSWR